jgi:hypothetical protein
VESSPMSRKLTALSISCFPRFSLVCSSSIRRPPCPFGPYVPDFLRHEDYPESAHQRGPRLVEDGVPCHRDPQIALTALIKQSSAMKTIGAMTASG